MATLALQLSVCSRQRLFPADIIRDSSLQCRPAGLPLPVSGSLYLGAFSKTLARALPKLRNSHSDCTTPIFNQRWTEVGIKIHSCSLTFGKGEAYIQHCFPEFPCRVTLWYPTGLISNPLLAVSIFSMTQLIFLEHPKLVTFTQILVTVSTSSQNTNLEDIV